MGLLSFLKPSRPPATPPPLPRGSFTLDKSGKILTSTLPATFSKEQILEIGGTVLKTFRAAQAMQMPLSEFTFTFTALKLTARELRGGAIIFLAPREFGKNT
jgi:hypothetical protein